MKILFLHKYGPQSASYRHRLGQFLPGVENEKGEYQIDSLLDDRYLKAKLENKKIPYFHVLFCAVRRASLILFKAQQYDVVFIYLEAFPYFPGIFEWYLRFRKIPYVYDFDDAIFHQYDLHPFWIVRKLLGRKIEKVIRGARTVLAGSPYLFDYAKKLNQDVRLCPTVIDLNRYLKAKETSATSEIRIGWIGSPSTSRYLKSIEKSLKQFCKNHSARLILIGSGPVDLQGIPTELKRWSEETEVEDMLQFDIGVMPLDDSPWSRGKCGFKLIQYLACGVPVIASPVGVNPKIVEDGQNGILASTPEEWSEAFLKLSASSELRKHLGDAGRRKMEKEYSVEAALPTFIHALWGKA